MAGRWGRPHYSIEVSYCWAGPCLVLFSSLSVRLFPLVFSRLFQWSAAVTLWCAFQVCRIPLVIGTAFFPHSVQISFASRAAKTPQKFYQYDRHCLFVFSGRGASALSPFRLHLKRLSQCCSVSGFVACVAASSTKHCVVCRSEPVLFAGKAVSGCWCAVVLCYFSPTFRNWCVEKIFCDNVRQAVTGMFSPSCPSFPSSTVCHDSFFCLSWTESDLTFRCYILHVCVCKVGEMVISQTVLKNKGTNYSRPLLLWEKKTEWVIDRGAEWHISLLFDED